MTPAHIAVLAGVALLAGVRLWRFWRGYRAVLADIDRKREVAR